MKRWHLIVGGVVVLVMLTVLLVPGVAESIEGRVLAWLAGSAQ